MILAEGREVLTRERRAAAWCKHGEKTWWACSPVGGDASKGAASTGADFAENGLGAGKGNEA
jgi:hypothetical protein